MKKWFARIITLIVMITLLFTVYPAQVLAGNDIAISDYELLTKYPSALTNDSADYIEQFARGQISEALGGYDGWWDSLASAYKKTLTGWSEVFAREIAGVFNESYSNYGSLREEVVRNLVINIAKVDDIHVSKLAENALSGYNDVFKNTYDLASETGRYMFCESLKTLNFSKEQIKSAVDAVYKDIDRVDDLLKGVDYAIVLSDAIAASIMVQDVQVELLDTILEYIPENSELYNDLQLQRERVVNNHAQNIAKDILEHGIIKKLSKLIEKGTVGLLTGNPGALTLLVANLSLEQIAKLIPGASADDVIKATMLTGIMANFDYAITDLKIRFLSGKYSQADIDAYPIVYSAYISTVKSSLEQAKKIEKKAQNKEYLENCISIWEKYTYSKYMEFCKNAVKLQPTLHNGAYVSTVSSTISVGEYHALAITNDGSLWAWGDNESGKLGNGKRTIRESAYVTIEDQDSEVPIKIMDNVLVVSAGNSHSAVIKTDNSLWTWGLSGSGQLGNGNMSYGEATPIKIMDDVSAVSAGAYSTMAIKRDKSLWAWGLNDSGQLGIYESVTNISVPTKIADDVIGVSVGYSHAAALKSDGQLYVWGDNSCGQIGDGTRTNRSSLVNVMENVVAFSCGMDSTAAIKNDNSLWVWGDWYVPDDDNTYEYDLRPIKVLDNVLAVSSGVHLTAIIKTDNSLWISFNNTTKFEKLLDDVVNTSAGDNYIMAITSDGSLWTFGDLFLNRVSSGRFNENGVKFLDQVMLPDINNITISNLDSAATWAHDGIISAITKGFIPSDLQNSYISTITRQEFCRMAVKWLEYKTGKTIDMILSEQGKSRNSNAFTDTSDSDILAAYALGITNGTGNNQFTPNGSFTREQAATMLRNTCRAAGIDVSNVSDAGFIDINTASSWAVDGINYVKNAGIMSGTSTTSLVFRPREIYSRQESIVTFDRIQ